MSTMIKKLKKSAVRSYKKALPRHEYENKKAVDKFFGIQRSKSFNDTSSSALGPEVSKAPPEAPPLNEVQQARMERLDLKKTVPSPASFSSTHVLVNRERVQRKLQPLVRCSKLDAEAREKAKIMAENQSLSEPIDTESVSENVERGPSIRLIHQIMMFGMCDSQRSNIFNPKFTKFGTGTAKGEDGMIYMSQLFSSQAQRRGTM